MFCKDFFLRLIKALVTYSLHRIFIEVVHHMASPNSNSQFPIPEFGIGETKW